MSSEYSPLWMIPAIFSAAYAWPSASLWMTTDCSMEVSLIV